MRYTIYGLDVYPDGDGSWVENDRFLMGEVEISMQDDAGTILDRLGQVEYHPLWTRGPVPLLPKHRRNKVTLVDLYGGGDWLEVQMQVDERPLYGLQREA